MSLNVNPQGFTFAHCIFAVVLIVLSAKAYDGQIPQSNLNRFNEVIPLCDLRKEPAKFKDRELEVEAMYVANFEVGRLVDIHRCDRSPAQMHAILFGFDDEYRKRTSPSVLKQFDRMIKRRPQNGAMMRQVPGKYLVRVGKHQPANPGGVRFEYQILIVKILAVTK